MTRITIIVFAGLITPILALAQGFPLENSGNIVRDPPEGLRVEDMRPEELRERYLQYKAGKRDARDGYIILNQMAFNCALFRAQAGPECPGLIQEKEELLRAHPEFNSLQEFHLSDRKRWLAEKQKKEAELAAKRKEEEERPRPEFGRMLLFGDKMAVQTDHPKSLRFFDVPKDHAVICIEKGGGFRNQRSAGATGGACTFAFCANKDVNPLPRREGYSPQVELVSCNRPIKPKPREIVPLEDWVVVKSPGYVNLEAPFFLAATEYRGAGEHGPVYPKSPFARIYGIDGKTLYELGEKSEPPASIVTGLGADKSGALFGLGEFVTFDNGCDDETSPQKMRKLFLWESSGETKAVDSSSMTAEVSSLMSRFRIHESKMPWYKWPRQAETAD